MSNKTPSDFSRSYGDVVIHSEYESIDGNRDCIYRAYDVVYCEEVRDQVLQYIEGTMALTRGECKEQLLEVKS